MPPPVWCPTPSALLPGVPEGPPCSPLLEITSLAHQLNIFPQERGLQGHGATVASGRHPVPGPTPHTVFPAGKLQDSGLP